jgi:hypothetical protein
VNRRPGVALKGVAIRCVEIRVFCRVCEGSKGETKVKANREMRGGGLRWSERKEGDSG